jgi:hypothetical protein
MSITNQVTRHSQNPIWLWASNSRNSSVSMIHPIRYRNTTIEIGSSYGKTESQPYSICLSGKKNMKFWRAESFYFSIPFSWLGGAAVTHLSKYTICTSTEETVNFGTHTPLYSWVHLGLAMQSDVAWDKTSLGVQISYEILYTLIGSHELYLLNSFGSVYHLY